MFAGLFWIYKCGNGVVMVVFCIKVQLDHKSQGHILKLNTVLKSLGCRCLVILENEYQFSMHNFFKAIDRENEICLHNLVAQFSDLRHKTNSDASKLDFIFLFLEK